jgi:plastocyanin
MRRRLRPYALIGCLGLVLLVVAGCGGKKLEASQAVATTHVDLPPSYRFSPAVVKVKAGTKVTWTNHDHFTHSVRFDSGPAAGTHVVKPGQSYAVTFPAKGTFAYDCSFHPHDMKGEVIVQ